MTKITRTDPARGRVGTVMDCGVSRNELECCSK